MAKSKVQSSLDPTKSARKQDKAANKSWYHGAWKKVKGKRRRRG